MEFELLVARAVRRLPAIYRRRLDGVAVVVEDEPSAEDRRELGLAPDELLFGLYDGVPLTDPARAGAAIGFPDRIVLYQRSFERACSTRQEVEEEVRLTVLHEVGHFFGLDEDALHHV
jgi:predicted Zn-dependent protease with MMP-like domain